MFLDYIEKTPWSNIQVPFSGLDDRGDIFVTPRVIIIKSEISTFHIVVIFSAAVCLLWFPIICCQLRDIDLGEAVHSLVYATNWAHFGIQFVLVCLHITHFIIVYMHTCLNILNIYNTYQMYSIACVVYKGVCFLYHLWCNIWDHVSSAYPFDCCDNSLTSSCNYHMTVNMNH